MFFSGFGKDYQLIAVLAPLAGCVTLRAEATPAITRTLFRIGFFIGLMFFWFWFCYYQFVLG